MDELISRANALKAIDGCKVECVFPDDKGFNEGLDKAFLYVKHAPTVAAEPVRHARWVNGMMLEPICSECRYHGDYDIVKEKYCPGCGARMDLDHLGDTTAMVEKEDSHG